VSNLFDETVYRSLCSELGDADTVEVLALFFADTVGKMTSLATNSETRPHIMLVAHSIKSSAATFGFAELSRLAQELEAGSTTFEPRKLRESILELQRVFAASHQYAQANLLNADLATAK